MAVRYSLILRKKRKTEQNPRWYLHCWLNMVVLGERADSVNIYSATKSGAAQVRARNGEGCMRTGYKATDDTTVVVIAAVPCLVVASVFGAVSVSRSRASVNQEKGAIRITRNCNCAGHCTARLALKTKKAQRHSDGGGSGSVAALKTPSLFH